MELILDSVARVNSIVSTPSLEPKFDVVCDELQIIRFLPSQKRFISEYVQVMKPVCDGLDKLQGDTEIAQGYLLPTLYVMTTKLEKLLDRGYDTDRNPLPPKLIVSVKQDSGGPGGTVGQRNSTNDGAKPDEPRGWMPA